jgi:hypothetical protein
LYRDQALAEMTKFVYFLPTPNRSTFCKAGTIKTSARAIKTDVRTIEANARAIKTNGRTIKANAQAIKNSVIPSTARDLYGPAKVPRPSASG